MTQRILLCKITAAHGIKGDMKCHILIDDLDFFYNLKTIYNTQGQPYHIQSIRPQDQGHIIHFKGVDDRTQAEQLKQMQFWIEKSDLPAIDDEDEYYIDDLIGCSAFLTDGTHYGEVVAVWDFGAGDIVEIQPIDAKDTIMILFKVEFVPQVDIENKRIEIILPNYI